MKKAALRVRRPDTHAKVAECSKALQFLAPASNGTPIASVSELNLI
ncbi:MAG: hypothetical protein AAGL89_07355 [Pseudomonadota bacterium]